MSRIPIFHITLEKTEGARDAKGPDGPTGLDTSRYRGLSKSGNPPSLFELWRASRKSAKSQGVPRAVFEVCSASPPVVLPFQATLLSFRIVRPLNHRF